MKFTFLQIAVLATLAFPIAAQAQGTVRGAQEGAAAGNRDAGPVGAVVGGAVGAVTGTIGGILGIDDRPVSRNMSHTRSTHRTTTAICELERFCRQTE
jgi:hypothetical protein